MKEQYPLVVERSRYLGPLFVEGRISLGALSEAIEKMRANGFTDAATVLSNGSVSETIADPIGRTQ